VSSAQYFFLRRAHSSEPHTSVCSIMSTSVELKVVETSTSGVESEKPREVKSPVLGFLFFGMVGLLCFNFFLLVLHFLELSFSREFPFYANIVYGLSNNCGQLLVIFYGSKLTFSRRVYLSCTALAIILVSYGVVALFRPSVSVGMGLGLLLTFGLGFFNAILQSAGFGLAGICSSKSMEYFCLGQAVCGLAPWPLMLLLNLIFSAFGLSTKDDVNGWPSEVDTATAMTSLAIAAGVTLLMVPFYKFYLSRTDEVESAIAGLDTYKESEMVPRRSKLAIIKSTMPLALSVWFVLYVTFVVFPGSVFQWKASYADSYPDVISYASMMIYVFQVFDVVGRYMPAFGLTLEIKGIKIGSLMRIVLIPLFFMATYNVSFFTNDITRMMLMAVFAASNGFVLTWGMIRGPGQVDKDERDVASYTMSFFLVNGIFCGSMTALIIDKITKAV
jgi:hypothetical protein